MKGNKGFTLLEIIIVIIIVGVLAGLAVPRFFRTVEYSRGMEALSNLGTLRQSINRCYLQNPTAANWATNCILWTDLDVENPNTPTNAMFTYTFAIVGGTPGQFTITATRNGSTDVITIDDTGSKRGTGVFGAIR
ncbi:MAG: prepilin-type N-terminal cleavage/methylation domain-containing protein [Candidatus Omnitrophota bacterium]